MAQPYLVVRNGPSAQNIIDDIKHAQAKTVNPNFYRSFELPTMIPGNPLLTIEVWDKDAGGSQLIGETEIDVENRLLSQETSPPAPPTPAHSIPPLLPILLPHPRPPPPSPSLSPPSATHPTDLIDLS